MDWYRKHPFLCLTKITEFLLSLPSLDLMRLRSMLDATLITSPRPLMFLFFRLHFLFFLGRAFPQSEPRFCIVSKHCIYINDLLLLPPRVHWCL